MIGISSLDLLAFPLRQSGREVAAVIDARKGELFSAFYRPVPGGVQRLGEPRCGSVEDLDRRADGAWPRQRAAWVTARCATARDRRGRRRCDFAEQFLSHPSAAPLVQLAHARALREEWVNPWEIQPLYLRAPDAQINWSTRASAVAGWTMSVLSRLLSRGDAGERSRHRADASSRISTDILAIEQVSYPKPWSRERLQSEIETGPGRASVTTSSLARGATVVGYAGLMFVVGDAHVTNIAVDPDRQRAGIGDAAAGRAGVGGDRRGCKAMTLEVRVSNTGAQALYRSFGFVPAGSSPAVLREHRGRHRDVVPRHRRGGVSPSGSSQLSPRVRAADRDRR